VSFRLVESILSSMDPSSYCLREKKSFIILQPRDLIVHCSLNLVKFLCSSRLIIKFSLNLQQVYMYFRGSGKAAEMKREAARSALSSAF
jgi:hypothetical protein